MSGPTRMLTGAPGSAAVVANAALFGELTRGDNALFDQMSSGAKTPAQIMKMIEMGHDFMDPGNAEQPIVDITDLSTKRGDKVGVDLMHARIIEPVMGDEQIGNRRGQTTFASQEGKIDQFVFPWSGGGQMAQQRTPHDLRKAAISQETRSGREYIRQLILIQMAGARGHDVRSDWALPLATAPDFAKKVINAPLAPTYSRHMYAGGAKSIAELDTTCYLTLRDISRLAVHNREHAHPMARVVVPNDPAAETQPLGILLVTERVWYHLRNAYSGNNRDWTAFMMAAQKRGGQNPLFSGDMTGMWDGILVKVMNKPIRFGQGQTLTVATSAKHYTEATATVPTFESGGAALDYAVDRCLFLGGSAVARVWGRNVKTGVPTDFYEGFINDGREYVSSLAGIGGIFKLRFRSQEDEDIDHGVTVMDCYAPNPELVPELS